MFSNTFAPFTAVTLSLLAAANALPSNTNQLFKKSTTKTGFINVTVATLWTNSSMPRVIDAPAISSPVDIPKWLSSMTVDQFRDLTDSSRTQSQALYGARVEITDTKDNWYEVAVTSQISPNNKLGYPGWIPASQVAMREPLYEELQDKRPFALVNKGPMTALYHDVQLKRKIMDLSYNTRLPLLLKLGKAVQVAVPGSIGYLAASEVSVYNTASDIPYPTGQDLIESGKMFLNHPYLWGGASGYAFDCSGFTSTMYAAHGIAIARDSGPQAYFTNTGPIIDRSDLQTGDLIFYASNTSNPKSIYHVAMYAGDDNMLESYAAGTPLRLTPVRFNDDYWGAKRYLEPKK
ncbi:nlpC/P60 family domain-containing protein [Pochonia chlamydosporia 170]|uniref:NlpC/P60 family domain-containing protein n=1 Tax=Pochonia chlamydosporia 170 TaxID=1380566 RepID=A0A179F6X9_METCM|nr:nlpC/P60 family domain-containing protein [Pochonia chlamydosporia 170]OAQ61162.2 nlpC/P60 family domain-containing protein [Pochonia chlamydosporia 170]